MTRLLHHADFNHEFYGASDASGSEIGGVVYQIIDNTTRYICFYSCSLSPSERNYSATKRELLGMIFTICKGHSYFWGRRFTFYTDHAALTYIRTQPKLNAMITNWFEELLGYDMTIHHRPGVLNILPDHLSRLYPVQNTQYYPVLAKSASIVTDIPTVSNKPVDYIEPINLIEDFEEPLDEYRQDILLKSHLLGHFGADAIVQDIRGKGIDWPGITVQASKLVKSCLQCQRHAVAKKGYHPVAAITASLPGDHYAIDLAGPWQTTDRGHHFLLVCVDICTRFCQLRPLPDKSSLSVALSLVEIFCILGFPKILQSDNGSEFVNEIIQTIRDNAGFDHRLITPYHPQANGTAERWVGIATKAIIKQVNGVQRDWDLHVATTQYAINLKVSARHGSTPFSLMFAQTPNGFSNYTATQDLTANFDAEGYLKKLQTFTDIVFPAINKKTQDYITARFNDAKPKRATGRTFPEGSFVMATNKNKANKFEANFEGPYKVIRQNKGGAYLLQDADGAFLPRNYAADELKIISHDPDDFGTSYVVEKILDHRGKAPSYKYKVKWKGYDAPTWEPASNFDDKATIDRYWTTWLPTMTAIATQHTDRTSSTTPSQVKDNSWKRTTRSQTGKRGSDVMNDTTLSTKNGLRRN